jgi:threonine/homoserine/homoserine lactone efflux protein
MLDPHTLFLWLALMCPLIFSPGPANLSVAGLTTQHELRAAMPFIGGLCSVNLCLLLLIGFAFGQLHHLNPYVFNVIEIIGALYIGYLSYCFFTSPPFNEIEASKTKHLNYCNGVTLQLLNAKFYPTVMMMYSTFLEDQTHIFRDVLLISILLTLLGFSSYLFWAFIGTTINKTFSPHKINFIQRYVFSGMLLIIGIWLLFDALH